MAHGLSPLVFACGAVYFSELRINFAPRHDDIIIDFFPFFFFLKAARKARNRLSAAQLTVPAGAGTEGGGRSHKRRPTVNRRPASNNRLVEEDEKVVKEVEDKVKTGEEEEKRQVAKDEVEGKSLPQGVVPVKAGALAVCFPQGLICYSDFPNEML